MKHPFRLSKSNKIYISIVVILYSIFKLISTRFSAHGVGEVIGFLIFVISAPLIFAYVNWLVNGRKKNGGTITFNITLSIVLIAQMGIYGNELNKIRNIRDIVDRKEKLKEELLRQGDFANVDSINSEFSQSQSKNIDALIQLSSGDDKKAYQKVNVFRKNADSISTVWSNALNEVNKPRILDFSLLTNDEECEYQWSIVQNYLAKSLDYQVYFKNRITSFERSIKELTDRNNELAMGMLDGLTKKHQEQTPIFEPLIEAHINYGSGMADLIRHFQNQKGKWAFDKDDMLRFEDSDAQFKYENLIQDITKSENIINELSTKLIEAI